MSRLTPLLLVSGAANLVALGVVVWSHTQAPSAALPPPAPLPAAVGPPLPAEPAPPSTWEDLAAATGLAPGDEPTPALLARLRAEGFPVHVIRAICKRMLDQHYAAAEQAAVDAVPLPPLQADRRTWFAYRRHLVRSTRDIDHAKDEALHALLGDDAESPAERTVRIRRFGDLPYELTQQLAIVESDYQDLVTESRDATFGLNLPADREQFALIESERQRDLAALLSPEQWAEYQLRSSSTARNLVSRLRDFAPTEAEYRAVYALQSAFDQQFAAPNGAPLTSTRTGGSADPRRLAQQQLDQDIAAALGPERYAEYALQTSPEYRRNSMFAAMTGQTAQTTAVLTQLELSARAETSTLRSLPPAAREAALRDLQTRTRASAAAVLSPAALEAYEKQFGSWIGRLAPTPPSASGAAASATRTNATPGP